MSVDPELIGQKDAIWGKIHENTLDAMRESIAFLEIIAPMWIRLEYHYKGKELVNHILPMLENHVDEVVNRQRLLKLINRAKKLHEKFFIAEQKWKNGE